MMFYYDVQEPLAIRSSSAPGHACEAPRGELGGQGVHGELCEGGAERVEVPAERAAPELEPELESAQPADIA
jgi:hypothetical protein